MPTGIFHAMWGKSVQTLTCKYRQKSQGENWPTHIGCDRLEFSSLRRWGSISASRCEICDKGFTNICAD